MKTFGKYVAFALLSTDIKTNYIEIPLNERIFFPYGRSGVNIIVYRRHFELNFKLILLTIYCNSSSFF